MNTVSELWRKFAKSRKYREAFVASTFKKGIPFQIRALRKQRGWSQEQLAANADLTQGVVSRAEDPNYGNLTFNTILRIAAGFDVAFIGRFVRFSELDKWFVKLSEKSAEVPSFGEEVFALGAEELEESQHAVENVQEAEGIFAVLQKNVIPFDKKWKALTEEKGQRPMLAQREPIGEPAHAARRSNAG